MQKKRTNAIAVMKLLKSNAKIAVCFSVQDAMQRFIMGRVSQNIKGSHISKD